LLRSRINSDLARREYESISLDGLRVRPDRLRSILGGNNFAHGQWSVASGQQAPPTYQLTQIEQQKVNSTKPLLASGH